MHIASDGQVVAARHQVLPDSQHVDIVRAQVAHHLKNFFISFTETHHQAGLGRYVWAQGFEAFE